MINCVIAQIPASTRQSQAASLQTAKINGAVIANTAIQRFLFGPCKHPIREAAFFRLNAAIEDSQPVMCSRAQKFFNSCGYLSGVVHQNR
jgi:hypothetical protein